MAQLPTPYLSPNFPNPQNWGSPKLSLQVTAKRYKTEQKLVLTGIEKSWVGFRLVQIQTPQHSLTPKIGDLTTPFKLMEMTEQHFELIGVVKSYM